MLLTPTPLFWKAAAASDISVLLTDGATQAVADTATTTFTSRNIGTASANRRVLVMVGARGTAGGTRTITGLTIGGVAAKLVVASAASANPTAVFFLQVPSGTTANIVVTGSGTLSRCGISIYQVDGSVGIYASGSAAAPVTATSISLSQSIPARGTGLWCVSTADVNDITWTNATEQFDQSPDTVFRFSSGNYVDLVGTTTSATASWASSQTSSMCGVYVVGAVEFVGKIKGIVTSAAITTVNFSSLNPQAGDLLVYAVAADSNGGSNDNIDAVTAGYATAFNNDPDTTPCAVVQYKVLAAGETSLQIASTLIGANRLPYFAMLFRGVDPTTPLDVAATSATGATGDPDCPAITTATDKTMIVAIGFIDDDNSTGVTAPTGYSDADHQPGGGSADATASIVMATKLLPTAGTENPSVFTVAGADDNWVGVTLALRKAA